MKKNLAWLAAMALTMGTGLQPMNVEAVSTISYEHYIFIPGDAINLNYDGVVTRLDVPFEMNDSIALYKSRGSNDKPYWCGRKEHNRHRQR